MWKDLTMQQRAELMDIYLGHGITSLDDMRRDYDLRSSDAANTYREGGSIHISPSKKGTFTAAATKHGMGVQEFASKVLAHPENYSPAMRKKANFARNASKWHGLGGNLYDLGGDTVGEWINTIYQNNPKEDYLGEPAHHYDFTQSEEWANAHGYYPDARGHRDDRVKKPAHPSHSSRGVWDGDKFVLSELGIQNPNYTLFGLNDGGQDPQATLVYKGGNVIPETTVTPSGNYIFNPYDNIKIKFANGGHIYDGITEPTQQMDNSYSYIKPLSEVIVDNEGNVRDPEVPSARGTIQLPEITVNTPDWKNMVGRYSIASNDALRVTGLRPQNTHLNKQAEEGAARRAAWARENPGLETAGLIAGAAPFAVAATPAIVGGGELAYPILTNPYVDAGITSAFAGHGLNHAINEGIDGYGDAFMTALELAPLGRVAKTMWNAGKNNVRAFYDNLTMDLTSTPGTYYVGYPKRDISTLMPGKTGGIFLTPDKKFARGYTGAFGTGKVYETKVNFGENPIHIDAKGNNFDSIAEQDLLEAFDTTVEEMRELGLKPFYTKKGLFSKKPPQRYYHIDEISTFGKKKGASSLIVDNVYDQGPGILGFGTKGVGQQVIVYSPEQLSRIK